MGHLEFRPAQIAKAMNEGWKREDTSITMVRKRTKPQCQSGWLPRVLEEGSVPLGWHTLLYGTRMPLLHQKVFRTGAQVFPREEGVAGIEHANHLQTKNTWDIINSYAL